MATLAEWRTFFYADISAQLRRHGFNQTMFDGLYLSKTSITGSWLLEELVTTSQTLAYQNVSLELRCRNRNTSLLRTN